tara:strand:+ start:6473 stop:6868 length:396 start_codon:yes stop_codon:yes gene_type:complete
MNILHETEKLKIEYEFELARLTEKSSGNVLFEDDFYGNPSCGIIDSENNWAIIAGIHLRLWKPNQTKKFQNESFEWVHSLRIKNPNIIEILTDPWNIKSSVWELNIENSELTKVRDFKDYQNKEYTENVEW